MNSNIQPRDVIFDRTPEIFATGSSGTFSHVLREKGEERLDTASFDEMRIVVSIWHPSSRRTIDLDRAYVELRASFDPGEEHWVKLAEIEPVVPPFNPDGVFDGWIVLPVLAASNAYSIWGSGFEPRARIQVRASAYLVA
ncbi:MAG: hypothetical protein OES47_00845 [Acidobacteriota bacterium]|nr:hypothetical protein [Acidobacteriota bacterium]